MIRRSRFETEHASLDLLSWYQDVVNVFLPRAFSGLELDDVAGQVRVAIVGSLPTELDSARFLVQHFESERGLGSFLYRSVRDIEC